MRKNGLLVILLTCGFFVFFHQSCNTADTDETITSIKKNDIPLESSDTSRCGGYISTNELPEGGFLRVSYFMKMKMQKPAEEAVPEPEGDDLFSGLDVYSTQIRTEETKAGTRVVWRIYELEASRAGVFEIPAYTMHQAGDNSGQEALTVESIQVRVTPAFDPGHRGLKDTIALREVPASPVFHILRIVLICALLVAAAVGVFLFRRYNTNKKNNEPAVPLHTRMLDSLSHVKDRFTAGSIDRKEFYQRLSLIIRRYSEGRFLLPFCEKTTEELYRDPAVEAAIPGEYAGQLKRFLQRADLVKFAGHSASREECGTDLAFVRKFIIDTIPPPEHTTKEGDKRPVREKA